MFRFPCAVRANASALDNIDHDTGDADHEHAGRVEVVGTAEPANGLDDDGDRSGEKQHAVDLRGEHFGAVETVRMALGGRSLREGQCA